jgi:negative regulator of replication initiation
MAQIIIEIKDDLAKYLQTHADQQGLLLSDVLSEMIDENLSMSDDIEEAIRISGMDVADISRPVVAAMKMAMSGLHYHKENVRLLERDALSLCTLAKVDTRRGDRTRDGFLSDLMDRLDEVV